MKTTENKKVSTDEQTKTSAAVQPTLQQQTEYIEDKRCNETEATHKTISNSSKERETVTTSKIIIIISCGFVRFCCFLAAWVGSVGWAVWAAGPAPP